MNADSILCKIFKTHSYIDIFNNKKYLVRKCSCCDEYIITHKDYSIKSKYKSDELPEKFKELIS